jgi:hypothetical protein
MNDAILSLLITSIGAILALIVRYSYYSKCDRIECFCCKIHRAVATEGHEIEEVRVSVPQTPRSGEQKNFSRV